jgi:hypothetical protein
MGYSAITNAEIDAESPSKDTLMAKYRDNLLQVETWIKDRIDDIIVSNWKAQTPGGAQPINDVWYNEDTGRWVFVADAGIIRWSDNDGIDWNAEVAGPAFGANNIYGVSYDGSARWVACGADAGAVQGAAWSDDGKDWTITDSKFAGATARAIVHDLSGLWVVVGDTGKISSSPDGINWTARASGTANTLYDVCFAEGLFVVTGAGGVILTSPDGINWTARASGFGASAIIGVGHGDGTFVAVGAVAKFASSPDGITWSIGDTGIGAGETLRSVNFDDGRWVAVASNGIVITSADAATWTQRSTVHGTSTINGVARNGGPCWMIVGVGPKLSTSLLDPNRNVIP